MILDAAKLVLPAANFWVIKISESTVALVLVTLGAILLLWRLWTFTIMPILYPQEPRKIPYWIPVLGHAMAFFQDSHALITYGRELFNDCREPFAITVAGKSLYILTSPEDVAAAYRNVTTLSWDAYLNDLLIAFGLDSTAMKKVWQAPTPKDGNFKAQSVSAVNPLHKSLIHLTEDLYKQQLLPGKNLDALGAQFLDVIDGSLHWERLCGPYVLFTTKQTKYVSLLGLCERMLVDAITRSMFGNYIYEIEPELTQSLLDFNDDVWMLIFHYPQIAARQLYAAKHKIMNALKKHIQSSRELRIGESWLIETVAAEQKITGIDDENRAAMLLMIYWAAVSNAYKMCFWVLSYIIFDKSLLNAIRAETRLAIHDGKINVQQLVENSPRLEAVYHETLRMVNGAISARKVVEPTKLGGKILSKGSTILIPYRQLHLNKEVFGSDARNFDPDRFLKDKHLDRNSSFRPYGGGVTYCPGRFLAKQEVFGFVALLLNRFEVELAISNDSTFPSFPQLDDTVPALGITGPMKGMDVYVNLSKPTA